MNINTYWLSYGKYFNYLNLKSSYADLYDCVLCMQHVFLEGEHFETFLCKYK